MVREYKGLALGMEQELNHVFTLNDANMNIDGCSNDNDLSNVVVKQEMISYIKMN